MPQKLIVYSSEIFSSSALCQRAWLLQLPSFSRQKHEFSHHFPPFSPHPVTSLMDATYLVYLKNGSYVPPPSSLAPDPCNCLLIGVFASPSPSFTWKPERCFNKTHLITPLLKTSGALCCSEGQVQNPTGVPNFTLEAHWLFTSLPVFLFLSGAWNNGATQEQRHLRPEAPWSLCDYLLAWCIS